MKEFDNFRDEKPNMDLIFILGLSPYFSEDQMTDVMGEIFKTLKGGINKKNTDMSMCPNGRRNLTTNQKFVGSIHEVDSCDKAIKSKTYKL